MKEVLSAIKDIENKNFSPYYILEGNEPYFLDLVTEAIDEHLLSEDQKSFDRHSFYGSEADWSQLLNLAQQFPMFGNKQLIMVKEVSLKKEHLDKLLPYFEKPAPHTVWVIRLKNSLDKRSKFYKTVKKHGIHLETKKMFDNQVPTFITGELNKTGRKYDQKIVYILADYIGNNLGRIHQEISKLDDLLPEGSPVDMQAVEKYIGISKEFNTFELVDAIGERKAEKALRIALHFAKNSKEHPYMVSVTVLYNYFSNLLLLHSSIDKSEQGAAAALKTSPYIARKHMTGLRYYPLKSVTAALKELRQSFGHAVGLNNQSDDGEKLKETILHLLSV